MLKAKIIVWCLIFETMLWILIFAADVRQKIEDIKKGREKRKTAQVLRLVHKF
mgnify:FL=1